MVLRFSSCEWVQSRKKIRKKEVAGQLRSKAIQEGKLNRKWFSNVQRVRNFGALIPKQTFWLIAFSQTSGIYAENESRRLLRVRSVLFLFDFLRENKHENMKLDGQGRVGGKKKYIKKDIVWKNLVKKGKRTKTYLGTSGLPCSLNSAAFKWIFVFHLMLP